MTTYDLSVVNRGPVPEQQQQATTATGLPPLHHPLPPPNNRRPRRPPFRKRRQGLCHSASRSPCGTPVPSHATISHPSAPSLHTCAPVSPLHPPASVRLSLSLPLFLFSKVYRYIALVQLFRVSVSASVNGPSASHADVLYASYARPLGATLVGFGMAVLVMGEPSSFPFPQCARTPN
jgi:hypothetical protein